MRATILCLVLATFATFAHAADRANERGRNEELLLGENFAGFLESHPDLLNYRRGLDTFRNGDPERALRHFRIAARYADKPSQAMIAEMYWTGTGVERDRPLAYAWMDLAAERGSPRLLAMRESYWASLDAAERSDALARGVALYVGYGDAVAQPRLNAVLRRKSKRIAGSRTGYTGNTRVIALMPGVGDLSDDTEAGTPPTLTMAAEAFYDPTYWDPENYYAWRDLQWEREFRVDSVGTTEVGPLEQVRMGKKPAWPGTPSPR